MQPYLADFMTRAVHGGRADLNDLGVHAPPLDFSTTYPFQDLDTASLSLDALVAGEADAPDRIYARLHNPTVARFEEAFAGLEQAEAAVAFSSGMAALTAILLAARQEGSHVVGVRPLYGTTDHLLTSGLLGMDVTWTTADDVASAIRPDTVLVLIETPANPTLQIVDIEDVVSQAGPIPVVVDSTFATPVLQQPLTNGASLVLHSATKFIGGHGDVMAGVVATSERWARRLRQVRVATGALLHPLAGYMLHRSLPTLGLRVERAQATAQILVDRLRAHEAVRSVWYPDMADERVRRQMRGPGAILAFEVEGGHESARALMQATRLITPAVSLGSTDTLLQHPAGLTHRVVDRQAREANGISDALLRMSVGLEGPDDLWRDLAGALNVCSLKAEPVLA